MSTQNKISFWGLTIYTLVVGFLVMEVGTLTATLLLKTKLSVTLANALGGLNAALFVIALTVALEMKLSQVSFKQALNLIGLKKGTRPQIKATLIGLSPLALAYLMIFAALEISSDTVSDLGWVMLRFLIAQGIAEEVVFRGFIFRHLRQHETFLRAATQSAILFSLIHLANFSHGFNYQIFIGVMLSLFFGFILTYPLARLFEVGAGSIIGGAILHVGIDSVNWFEQVSSTGMGLSTYLLGIAGVAIATMLATQVKAGTK